MRTCSHTRVTAADSADGALARSQAARRRRVIDATLELAAGGGQLMHRGTTRAFANPRVVDRDEVGKWGRIKRDFVADFV